MKITVLSENTVPVSFGLTGEHGLSFCIENQGKTFLFDTGQTGIAVSNAKKLGIDLKKTEAVVLSHGHYDHADGLEAVLKEIGHPVKIIAHPSVFDAKYIVSANSKRYIGMKLRKEFIEGFLKASFEFHKSFTEIFPGVYMTGEVPFTNPYEKIPDALQVEKNGKLEKDFFEDDNSLILESGKGLIVLLGCAHRGIINILSSVKEKLNQPIHAVIGGAHLHDTGNEQFDFVKNYLKKEKIALLAPSHCTGIPKIFELQKDLHEKVQPAFCGSVFEF
ncbi:MAG TPA: MBL fold metallo-hydrolase [Spirochaetia bacterium]|nr:MAG: hypothetical protein A2Y41_09410 [Spirochaetes bacterium GWB1_36_13]HCL56631.1 MBL fold metallo-hydrolase [Spirochaetia bacterium]